MTRGAQFQFIINGHDIRYGADTGVGDRYICIICRTVLLSDLQFITRVCPGNERRTT